MTGHLGSNRPGGVTSPLSGRGEVFSFTTMYNVPQGYEDQKPYTVALVKPDEGPMVTAQLTDVNASDVKIGMRGDGDAAPRGRRRGADYLRLQVSSHPVVGAAN